MKRLAVVVGAVALASAANAAGIDSRVYGCAELHALIAAQRFLFISQPAFGDFVVADGALCGGGDVAQRRSVPTRDAPECPVLYCDAYTSSEGR